MVLLSIVVGKISLSSRACMASQLSIVSLVGIVSLGSLAILASLSLLVIVAPPPSYTSNTCIVSFLPFLLFYPISPYSVG